MAELCECIDKGVVFFDAFLFLCSADLFAEIGDSFFPVSVLEERGCVGGLSLV